MIFLSESVLLVRHFFPVAASSGAVFSVAPREGSGVHPESFEYALAAYEADRGWQSQVSQKGQVSLTTFYFEWDRVETGPLMEVARHPPEVCNVASGFTFTGKGTPRTHHFPNGQTLVFDSTAFTTPGGIPVQVFKTSWLQGIGSLDIRRGHNRMQRLAGSFDRHAGQARVLQCGIFGASNDDQAWKVFQDVVLSEVKWTFSADVE